MQYEDRKGAETAAAHTPAIAAPRPLDADLTAAGADTRARPLSGPMLQWLAAIRDARSWLYAIAGGAGFFMLSLLSLSLSSFDSVLASVWLPNASAVALLLLARPRGELPVFAGIFIAGTAANLTAGATPGTALLFALGNCADIALVTWASRRAAAAGGRPDMMKLPDLTRFLFYGGALGPAVSALIVAPAFGWSGAAMWNGMTAWFLADSMGMLLVVPAALAIAEAWPRRSLTRFRARPDRIALMAGGLAATFLVFHQDVYPLLFLVPPVTLLVAFRLGGLGTVLFVPGIAIVASWMTHAGLGPIIQNNTSDLSKLYVLQAFVAANFLTGLPVAAILAGRERLMEALDHGRRELALLTEGITDAVLLIDRNGICRYASPSVIDVLGRPAGDYVGHPVVDLAGDDARERIESVLARLLSGESDKERLTYRRFLDGENAQPVFIEADCAIVADPLTGERGSIVVSARDVTDRVELELLLTRARRSAEEAASAKSEFLANMSHEIRTPMNGVLGFTELMLQSKLSAEHRHHATMIAQSGRSMMMLLNDILDLSKIEAGQIGIDREPVDAVATVEECLSLYHPSAEKKGVALTMIARDQRPGTASGAGEEASTDGRSPFPWVESDGLRLRQIILNIIGNAVKFTGRGSVGITLEAGADALTVEVRDTGIGIPKQRLDTVFAPFTQGESDTSRRFGGTGLGLAISRQLAHLLGGEITVESKVGAGSTFRLVLPATYVEPAREAMPLPDNIAPADLPQSSRILLVEDHDVNRLLGTEMLERCGQEVSIAQDGNEAIAMVIDSMVRAKPFDLVFMDIQMPGCDGYAATRAIRGEGIEAETLPIIALTANAFPEDIAAAREAGMQGHLAKPLVFADLARTLQRWLPTRIIEAPATIVGGQAADETRRDEDAGGAAAGSDPVTEAARAQRDGEAATSPPNGDMANAPMSPAPFIPPQSHSPALLARWNARRTEAIEAVRAALEDGVLAENGGTAEARDELARLVHKLAGTAAMFGEAKLGEQAAAFEHALRMKLPADARETLAFALLAMAHGPEEALAPAAD